MTPATRAIEVAATTAKTTTLNFGKPLTPTLREIGTDLRFVIPPYQRTQVWTATQKSALLDTLYRGLPVPAPLVYPGDKDHYAILDGQQRLTTIQHFYDKENPFKIGKVTTNAIANKTYWELPAGVQAQFDKCVLPILVSRPLTAAEQLESFRDINTKGCALSSQECRDGSKDDPLVKSLKEASEHPSFVKLCKLLKRKLRRDRGEDRQVVLQLFIFKDRPELVWNQVQDTDENGKQVTETVPPNLSRRAMDKYMEENRTNEKEDLLNCFREACDKITVAEALKTSELLTLIHQVMG